MRGVFDDVSIYIHTKGYADQSVPFSIIYAVVKSVIGLIYALSINGE